MAVYGSSPSSLQFLTTFTNTFLRIARNSIPCKQTGLQCSFIRIWLPLCGWETLECVSYPLNGFGEEIPISKEWPTRSTAYISKKKKKASFFQQEILDALLFQSIVQRYSKAYIMLVLTFNHDFCRMLGIQSWKPIQGFLEAWHSAYSQD